MSIQDQLPQKVLKQYPETKLKTVILHNGTNAIVKDCASDVEEVFNNYINLVEAVDEKLKPEQLVLMQTPPLRSNTRNHTANEKIKVFNQKLSNYLNCPAVKENCPADLLFRVTTLCSMTMSTLAITMVYLC